MTKAEQTRSRIDELVGQGQTKAEAFRALAHETGSNLKSLQGAYYNASRKANGGNTRARKRETTTTDALAQAITVLESAIESIDAETQDAKVRAEEATAEYQALKASAAGRKTAIAAKVKALRA